MIDIINPDFTNTPASDTRPSFSYAAQNLGEPYVSIITPYFNVGSVFLETVQSVQGMSFSQWEWLIVDDGTTDPQSIAQLDQLMDTEPRVRVIRQTNAGPGVARNRAVSESRGVYILQLDADDLMEPTFVEKALWLLETQSHFSACNSYNVTFGTKNLLWPYGFQQYEYSIDDNRMTMQAVIRRADWERIGGYDENVSYDHADWDFWLNLAEAGLWGYTIPEYLTWYRMQEGSLLHAIESNYARTRAFRAWLRTKHKKLRSHFPHPMIRDAFANPQASLPMTIPFQNPLSKPDGVRRVLLIIPWMEIGGADKFNLDLIAQLHARRYECTIVTTALNNDRLFAAFSALTPDIFRLHRFLTWSDYPRFLDYIIASRQVDAIFLSNSQFGYGILPYLRARHPSLPILDFNHLEEDGWLNGGYPRLSVLGGSSINLRLTCSEYLRQWMIERGAPAEATETVHCGVDTVKWVPENSESRETRQRLGIGEEIPLILFAGRMVDQKRPLLVGTILASLARAGVEFEAIIAGDGPLLKSLRYFIARNGLQAKVHILGAVSETEMRRLVSTADIVLLPSQHEGIALVLYEAMAAGTVPVAAAVGGQGELVTPACGYLIGHGPNELARYVDALRELVGNPGRRKEMARACRERVVTYFDVRAMGEQIHSAITRSLLARSTTHPTTLQEAIAQTTSAVVVMRQQEYAEVEWGRRNHVLWIANARRLREQIIPFGSQRYLHYRSLRQRLRQLHYSMRRL